MHQKQSKIWRLTVVFLFAGDGERDDTGAVEKEPGGDEGKPGPSSAGNATAGDGGPDHTPDPAKPDLAASLSSGRDKASQKSSMPERNLM